MRNAGGVPMGFWTFGMMFWWSWFLFYFFPQPLSVDLGLVDETAWFRIALMAGFTISAAIYLPLQSRLSPLRRQPGLLIASALGMTACSVMSMLFSTGAIGSIWLFMGTLVGGLSCGFFFMFWGELYGDMDTRRSGVLFSGAIMFGGAIYLLLLWLGSAVLLLAEGIHALLPWLCVLCISRARVVLSEPAREKTGRMGHATPIFLAYGAVYGFLYGLMLSLVVSNAATYGDAARSNLVAMLGLICAGIILFASSFKAAPDYHLALRLALVLVAMGFILLAVIGIEYSRFAVFFLVLGYIYFWLLFCTVWVEIAERTSVRIMSVGVWGFGASASSIALGVIVYRAFLINVAVDSRVLMMVALAACFLLLLLNMFLMDSRIFTNLGGMVPHEEVEVRDELALRVDALGKRFQLTPREKEIVVLIAKGRNPKRIQDELCVSVNTVRTHMHHIYEKCGIHSDQELIDLVEKVELDAD